MLSYAPQNSLSCVFLVRVGHKRHSWEVLRAAEMRHITTEQLAHLSPCWQEQAAGPLTSPPPLGSPSLLSSSWARCVCLALSGGAPAPAGHLLHQSWWWREYINLPSVDFVALWRLAILVGYQSWSPTFYIDFPFWLLPCEFQPPASETKITALQMHGNRCCYVAMWWWICPSELWHTWLPT